MAKNAWRNDANLKKVGVKTTFDIAVK